MQEAIETLVVRIVEEKAEAVVAAAVEAPDSANFPEPSDFLAALDAYLTMLPVARDIVREAVDAVVSELPVKAAAEASLEGLFAILQVRSRCCSVATRVSRMCCVHESDCVEAGGGFVERPPALAAMAGLLRRLPMYAARNPGF